MNTTKLALAGLVALALSVSARATDIPVTVTADTGYTSGDLLLGFYSASATNDLVFDLGQASNFTGLAAGTYNVAAFSSADLTTAALGSSAQWAVGGANGDTANIWTTAQVGTKMKATAAQANEVTNIDSVGGTVGGTLGTSGLVSSAGVLLAGKDFSAAIGGQNNWSGTFAASVAKSAVGTTSLELWSLPATSSSSGVAGIDLGTLTLDASAGTLTFTVIPEPSTYAVILGALTIGFVALRRRFSKAV
jgi:hypothetical protein